MRSTAQFPKRCSNSRLGPPPRRGNGADSSAEQADIARALRSRWRQYRVGLAVSVVNGCQLGKFLEARLDSLTSKRVLRFLLNPHRGISLLIRKEVKHGRLVCDEQRNLMEISCYEVETDQRTDAAAETNAASFVKAASKL
jgi:hypothetical protein